MRKEKVEKPPQDVRSEEALRESEERFRQVAENSGEWIWETDADGLYTYSSPISEKIIGYKPEEIVGRKFFYDFFMPELREELKNLAFEFIARKEKFHRFVNQNITKRGEIVVLETNGVPVLDRNGTLRGYRGAYRDITRQKMAEDALRESEERLRIASEISNDIIYEWFIQSGRVEVYGNAEEKLGPLAVEVGLNLEKWRDFVLPEDRDRVLAAVERHLKTGEPYSEEYRVRKRGGDLLYVLDRGLAFRDEKGRPYKWIGVLTDITEHKLAEEEISGWKKRYELIVEASGQVIYDYDVTRGRILWGGSMKDLLGYDTAAEEIGIDKWAELIHPDDRGQALGELDAARKKGALYDAEYRFRHKKGHYLWMRDRGRFIPDSRGVAVRMVGTMLDVTDRKRAENELKQAKLSLEEWSEVLEERVKERTEEIRKFQEMMVQQEKLAVLGQVSASISHELRTPLTGIKNSVYFLQMMDIAKQNPKIGEHISMINIEVDACVRVINNMLDFVRPKAPILRLSQLDEIVKKAVAAVVMPSNIIVTLDIQNDLPSLMIDPFEIQQAIENIIKNAIDAMGSGGELAIGAGVEGEIVYVEVKDTGIGIAPDNLGKIFDPLFSTTPTGVGLGLTVSRQFVEAHGGTIDAESKLGKGSTFRIHLPLRKG